MKIIKPSRRAKKSHDASSSIERNLESRDLDNSDYERTSKESSPISHAEFKVNTNRTRPKKKPRAYSTKQPKQSRNEYSASLDRSPEEEFDFDTSNLEAMPKHEALEVSLEGKKRRRSELQAEKIGEPLALVVDPAKKEFNELFARGLRLLAMREHSVKEITDKLFDKSENSSTIYAVVDELLEKKYLSDERFTESYIRARSNRGFGPVKIRSELKTKGVASTLIRDYLDEGASIWFDNAQSQYKKKYGDAEIGDYSAWTKRARFMQSRGFTMEQIHVAVPQYSPD